MQRVGFCSKEGCDYYGKLERHHIVPKRFKWWLRTFFPNQFFSRNIALLCEECHHQGIEVIIPAHEFFLPHQYQLMNRMFLKDERITGKMLRGFIKEAVITTIPRFNQLKRVDKKRFLNHNGLEKSRLRKVLVRKWESLVLDKRGKKSRKKKLR